MNLRGCLVCAFVASLPSSGVMLKSILVSLRSFGELAEIRYQIRRNG